MLAATGEAHERRHLERFEREGRRVVRIPRPGPEREWVAAAEETRAAMRAGADVVYQGVVLSDGWRGKADFLMKVDAPSEFGDWSYEAWDTQLARHPKPAHVFDGGAVRFHPFRATDRDGEKRAFEAFVDFVWARLKRWPDLHISHYAHYEPTALKRLTAFHAAREEEVDELLRREAFVDLYQVVRRSIRISHDNYSIKAVRHFFMPDAGKGAVTGGGESIVEFQRWLDTAVDDDRHADLRRPLAETGHPWAPLLGYPTAARPSPSGGHISSGRRSRSTTCSTTPKPSRTSSRPARRQCRRGARSCTNSGFRRRSSS